MKIIAIAAMAENYGIGKDNDLCWHLPEDMVYFKKTTEKSPVIMGSRTYDSIPEKFRPLPNRHNYVITRTPDKYEPHPDLTIIDSLEAACQFVYECKNGDTLYGHENFYVIGGGVVYERLMPYCDELLLTVVSPSVTEGIEFDTFFPPVDEERFSNVESVEIHDKCEMLRLTKNSNLQ